MGKVIDSKSVKKLEFEVIDEHMKRQNIGFFKQGFCVSIIHFRVYKTNRNFLFKKKTVKITCSCGAPNLDTINKMGEQLRKTTESLDETNNKLIRANADI